MKKHGKLNHGHGHKKTGVKGGVSMKDGFRPGSASPPEHKKQMRPGVDTEQGPSRSVNRSV